MSTTILLVDDEPAVLALLRRVLHDLAGDYDLITAPDGATALALIAQQPVALVITDYQMPDMDGVALTEAIKAVAPQCLVVLMTGYPTLETQHRARMAEADFYLPKPFRLDQLASIVHATIAS